MASYQVLYWRDIPTQIKMRADGKRLSAQLPQRFQTWIDRIAMRDGLTGTDAYLEQWQWSPRQEREGDAQEILDTLQTELTKEGDRVIETYKANP
jgi:hypothetical protein